MNGIQAYKSAVNLRSQRERDAEVFEVIAARLRAAEKDGAIAIAKALADNSNLWYTVITLSLDSTNPQPLHIRQSLLRLAASVLREMKQTRPDIRSLIEINGNIAAGLRGIAPMSDARNGAAGG
jgi:flagellar biosynthesis regulator FlaF